MVDRIEQRNRDLAALKETALAVLEKDETKYLRKSNWKCTSVSAKALHCELAPLRECLASIDAVALLNLELSDERAGGARLTTDACVFVKPIYNDIYPATKERTAVRYLHLAEDSGLFSMGVFIFPPGAKIPLHDHPGMCVLSRVLYGEIHRQSLDLVEGASDDDEDNNESDSIYLDTPGSKRAIKRPIDLLRAPACATLYPDVGNVHEFVAGPTGAAVLDVLLPPYDDERDCTFYEIHGCVRTENSSSANLENKCWIVPICHPKDFHCIAGQYHHL